MSVQIFFWVGGGGGGAERGVLWDSARHHHSGMCVNQEVVCISRYLHLQTIKFVKHILSASVQILEF